MLLLDLEIKLLRCCKEILVGVVRCNVFGRVILAHTRESVIPNHTVLLSDWQGCMCLDVGLAHQTKSQAGLVDCLKWSDMGWRFSPTHACTAAWEEKLR